MKRRRPWNRGERFLERDDTILGRVRLCRRCNEDWPLDSEFWFFQTRNGTVRVLGYCKACWSERDRSRWRRPKVAA